MIKRLVSLPTLFLILLSLFTLSIAFLQTEDQLPATTKPVFLRSQTITILDKEYNQFGSRYKAEMSKTSYTFFSNDNFVVGRNYVISGELIKYSSLDLKTSDNASFIMYDLSRGITGKIEKIKVEKVLPSCDLNCWVLIQTTNLKTNISKTYDNYYCKFYFDYLKIFGIQECQNLVGWATGLTIGGGESFSKDYKDLTKNLNLTHLLVVSGFQVSIFAAWIEIVLLKSGFAKKFRLLLAFLGLFVFTLIVGPEPPILRAILSLIISQQIVYWFGRKINPMQALIYSGLILLLLNPWWLYSYSFWLSFTTSAGLVITYNQEYILFNSKKWWKEIFVSSFVALIFSLPLVIDLNSGINLMGLVGNITIGPIIPILTLLNIMAILPVVGYFFAFLALHLEVFLIFITTWLSSWNASLSFSSLSLLDKIIYYLGIILIIVFSQLLTTKLKFNKMNKYDKSASRARNNSQAKT